MMGTAQCCPTCRWLLRGKRTSVVRWKSIPNTGRQRLAHLWMSCAETSIPRRIAGVAHAWFRSPAPSFSSAECVNRSPGMTDYRAPAVEPGFVERDMLDVAVIVSIEQMP